MPRSMKGIKWRSGDGPKKQVNEKGFFYGHPSVVIQFDDFIKLPTLEEYFTELTPQVSLRLSGGKRRFRVWEHTRIWTFIRPC